MSYHYEVYCDFCGDAVDGGSLGASLEQAEERAIKDYSYIKLPNGMHKCEDCQRAYNLMAERKEDEV